MAVTEKDTLSLAAGLLIMGGLAYIVLSGKRVGGYSMPAPITAQADANLFPVSNSGIYDDGPWGGPAYTRYNTPVYGVSAPSIMPSMTAGNGLSVNGSSTCSTCGPKF